MADIISIALALDTGPVLAGARQVDAALRQVQAASTSTAQSTKQVDQASRAAGQAMQTESTAATQASQALRQMEQASSGAGQAAAQLGQQVKTASGFLTRLGEQALAFGAGQAGIQGIAAAFTKVKEALTGAVQAAMNLESMTATFKAISGSSQAAEKDMAFLRQTATRLGIDFASLSRGFVTLSAAAQNTSLSGAALRDIFTAVAEKGRVLGKSADDINGALLAVGQSISKGTIQAEELRGQLSERLPGAFNDMARAMGVSTAELNKLLEAGKVGIENWAAWAAVVRRDLGSATEDASKTASAAIANLGNATGELSATLGKALLPALTATVNMLTSVVTAANNAAKAVTSFEEARRKVAEEATKRAGGANVATSLQEQFREAAAEEAAARAQLQRMQSWHGDFGAGFMRPGTQEEQEKAATERQRVAIARRIELGRQLDAIGKRQAETGDPFGEGIEPGGRDEKRVAAQQQLVDMTRANREELEKLDRVTQQLYGRKPTQDEILKVTEKQVETTRKWIDANQQNWNLLKDTGPAKELRAQAAGAETLEKSIKAAGEAGRAGKKEAADAAREEERARKEALDTTMAKGKAIYAQDQDVVDLLAEMQRRTQSLTLTEEERFAQRVRAMAEEHPAMAQLLEDELARYSAAQDTNDVLRERNKLLVDQATASKSHLDDLTRLQKQLEPSRRGQTTEERLATTRADIAGRVAGKPEAGEVLARADEQIRKTLDTELWHKWEDAGLDALDHVGKALEEFVFKGKLNFKDLLGSIAQDIFRTSLSIIQQQATKKGGWLEMGLNAVLKIGTALLGGGGGAPREGDPSFIGPPRPPGLQHGGAAYAGMPYMVGERGPELFVPRTSGTVVPHGQGVSSPTIVNVHVSGVQNAESFVQSRGAVSRAMMGALSQARQQM